MGGWGGSDLYGKVAVICRGGWERFAWEGGSDLYGVVSQEIEACLDAGAPIQMTGLIHECVSTDDLQIVTALLSRGAQ